MRRVALLALSFLFVGVWSHDGAKGQSSATPPVSLVPPDASPPRASAKNARPPPTASGRETSPPVIGGPPTAHPAADYDGFSAVDDDDAASQVPPPARSRAAKGSNSRSSPDTNGLAGQSSIDQEDDAVKRKLTICKNCK